MDSDWTNLPHHLVLSVIERLSSESDYLALGVVCKPWQQVANHEQSRLATRRLRTVPALLLIPNGNKDTWKVYDAMRDRVLNCQVRVLKKRFCGSSKGWLIVLEGDFEVKLINPFMRIEGKEEKKNSVIRLPRLRPPKTKPFWREQCESFVYKAIISADPISDANNCIVMAIYRERFKLAFIRLGKDTKWNYVEESPDSLDDVAHFRGQFYAINFEAQLFSFDIGSSSTVSPEVVVRKEELMWAGNNKRYLVCSTDDNEELLMVQRFFDYDGGKKRQRVTKKFKIFKLDFDKGEWLEESTLGDGALFIGDNSCIHVVASHFSGCKSNCIYFTHDTDRVHLEFGAYDDNSPTDYGVYDVKTKSFSQPYSMPSKALMEKFVKKSIQRPIWALPLPTSKPAGTLAL